MIATADASGWRIRMVLMRLSFLLPALALLAMTGRARADCIYTNQAGAVTFAPPATITLPNTTDPGTILWTSSPVQATNPPTLTCGGNTNNGLQNSIAGQAGSGDDTLFPTNVPGLSYRILYPGTSNPLHAYPNQPMPADSNFGGAFALQLVATGPIAPGSVLLGSILGQWNVDMCFNFILCWPLGPKPVETFSTSSVVFVPPACSIVTNPTVVTLPTTYSSAFTGAGSTPGQTPFSVQLNCPSAAAGASLSITLVTNNPVAGATGVIANTTGSGYAQNVGVQVLDGNGNPVSFGNAISAGTVTAGNFNVQLNARYYQTGAPVAAGQVKATATYTITYQ